jgi:hypothetical protein
MAWYHTTCYDNMYFCDVICDIFCKILTFLFRSLLACIYPSDTGIAGREVRPQERNETVFSHITHDITHDVMYDIINHDIIVGIVISLVVCDIMFHNGGCQSEQLNLGRHSAEQRRERSWIQLYPCDNTTFSIWYREVSSDGRAHFVVERLLVRILIPQRQMRMCSWVVESPSMISWFRCVVLHIVFAKIYVSSIDHSILWYNGLWCDIMKNLWYKMTSQTYDTKCDVIVDIWYHAIN